jgi:hypothetical protein
VRRFRALVAKPPNRGGTHNCPALSLRKTDVLLPSSDGTTITSERRLQPTKSPCNESQTQALAGIDNAIDSFGVDREFALFLQPVEEDGAEPFGHGVLLRPQELLLEAVARNNKRRTWSKTSNYYNAKTS